MATRRLEVELIGDDRSFQAMLRRSGRNIGLLERNFGRTGRAADQFFTRTGAAARTAAPYVAAFAGAGLAVAVKEAREAEKAGAQTRAVIKSMGGAANVTAKQVEELAESISVKAGMDDEAIQQGQNLLLTFANLRNEAGKGNKIFDRTTQLAVDMSVALDQDLKQSAIQLGKALNDPAVGLTALRRVGVSFNEQQTEQIKTLFESGKQLEAQKLILRELGREFKGSAAAQADGLDRFKVVAENYAEVIGKRILPTLDDYANEASKILSDKSLSGEEKADRLAELFEKAAIEGIDRLEQMAPRIAKAGGRIGMRMVTGFGQAWLESDLLGKLFLGGVLIRVLGGPGAFAALGKLIGTRVGASMAAAIAATTAASGAGGLFGGRGRGSRAPTTIAQAPFGGPSRGGRRGGLPFPIFAGGGLFGAALTAASILGPLDHGQPFRGEFDAIKRQRRDIEDVTAAMRNWKKLTREQREEARKLYVQLGGDTRQFGKYLIANRRDVKVFGRELDKAFDTGKVSKGLDRFLRKYKLNWRELQGITGVSGSRIAQIVANLAESLGASGVNVTAIKAVIGASRTMGRLGFARGGRLPGYSAVDNRLFALRDGEAILTPETHQPAVNAAFAWSAATGGPVGYGSLEDMFRKTGARVPGMAKGGISGRVSGPAGAMTAVASGSVETMEKAANAWIRKHMRASGPAGKHRSYPMLSGDTDFVPALGMALSRMARASGQRIYVTSGWRSRAEQAALYERLGPGIAAPPGSSNHERGRAADINPGREVFDGMARNFGLGFTVPHESWHIELLRRGGFSNQPRRGHHWVKGSAANSAGGRRWTADEAATLLWQLGASPRVAAALSAKVWGESAGIANRVGHDPGGTTGLGLWMITTGYNDELIRRLGGREAMFDPVTNARAALEIYRQQGIGAWYAPSSTPGRVKPHLTLSPWELLKGKSSGFKRQRDAVEYLTRRGIPRRTAQAAAERFIGRRGLRGDQAAKKKGGDGSAPAPAPASPTGMPAGLGLGNLSGLTYEDQLALLDIAAIEAEKTPGTADDLAVIGRRIDRLQKRDDGVIKRIRQLNKKIANAPKKRRKALRQRRSELIGEHAGLAGDIAALEQERESTTETDTADLAAEIKALREEIALQNKISQHELAIGLAEAKRFIADVFSGEVGARAYNQSHLTAGIGATGRS